MTGDVMPEQLIKACGMLRLAEKVDAVGGTVPRYVAAPASTREASALLQAAARLGLAVLPRGGGTRLDWGAPPRRCDLIVDMRLMDRVLEHAAGDLVVSVQAGVQLAQLDRVLAAAGQRLALDPPDAGQDTDAAGSSTVGSGTVGSGTVGGLIATGVAGPLRLRFGPPRDLLIGITMVRADGAVARAGGKVVKNVAGYDVGKLLAGSYGTLGLITEATFRLHPRPAAAACVSLECPDPATAQAVLLAAASSPLTPAAAELHWPSARAPISACVLLEGDGDGVAERAERMRDLLGVAAGDGAAASVSAAGRPAWWGRDAADRDATVLRIAFWASQLAEVLTAIRAAGAQAGLDPAVNGSAAAGVLHAALPPDAPADAVARFVTGLREALHETWHAGPRAGLGEEGPPSASAVVLHAPPAVREAVDLWGPVASLALMRAVKDQFDPEGRLAPGRLAGGI